MKYAILAAIGLVLSTQSVYSHGPDNPGYNRADPPGTGPQFKEIKLSVVPTPQHKVPESCDPAYREGMEKAFRNIWQQCQAIGKLEPSDCQRGLFHRCTKVANGLQKMEADTCVQMLGEKDALDLIKNPDNQKNSQLSAADINRRAASASKKVADALDRNAAELARQKKEFSSAMGAVTCAMSSAAPVYKDAEKKIEAELQAAETFVKTQAAAKREASKEFEKIAGEAHGSAEEMKGVAHKHSAKEEPFEMESSSKRKIPWVPILAVGIPAAVLGGIMLANRGKGGVGAFGGASDGPAPTGPPAAGAGYQDGIEKDEAPLPGGDDLRSLNMRVEPSFTDREKMLIAASVSRIPACQRPKLKNLKVSRANLNPNFDKEKCIAGLYELGSFEVRLDTNCSKVGLGVTLHEFFHVVGARNGEALHRKYKAEVFDSAPGCPVSEYAHRVSHKTKINYIEDFAEAGRVGAYPEGGDRYTNACVDKKIASMKKMLAECR